jgi:hypothetical protein
MFVPPYSCTETMEPNIYAFHKKKLSFINHKFIAILCLFNDAISTLDSKEFPRKKSQYSRRSQYRSL